MAQHHYLGFRGLVGESFYYVAELDQEWVALLGCAGAGSVDWLVTPTTMGTPTFCGE